jgi:hypothetical protein
MFKYGWVLFYVMILFLIVKFIYHRSRWKEEIPVSYGGEYEYYFWDVAPCSLAEVYRLYEKTV